MNDSNFSMVETSLWYPYALLIAHRQGFLSCNNPFPIQFFFTNTAVGYFKDKEDLFYLSLGAGVLYFSFVNLHNDFWSSAKLSAKRRGKPTDRLFLIATMYCFLFFLRCNRLRISSSSVKCFLFLKVEMVIILPQTCTM